jgi:hypothetical protein
MPEIIVFPPTAVQAACKSMKCDWCGEKILVLSPYVFTRGIFDGKLEQMVFHPDCFNAGRALSQEVLEPMTCWFKRGTTTPKTKEEK